MDLNDWLVQVLELGGSDLHITVGRAPTMRLNGKLVALDGPVMTAKDTKEQLYSIMTQEQRQALEVLLNSVTQKLLHDPIIFLKRDHSMKKSPHRDLDLVRRLFNLDLDRQEEDSEDEE